jgi:hypothetical protein
VESTIRSPLTLMRRGPEDSISCVAKDVDSASSLDALAMEPSGPLCIKVNRAETAYFCVVN